jgi:YidC/Oxa1 family membrane protein insertase
MISNFARIVRCPGVYPKTFKGFKQINYAGYLLKKNFSSAPPATDAEANLDNVNNLGAGLYGAPEQIQIKADELKATEHCYVEEGDIGNITSALQPLNESNTSDITEIISSLAPGTIYEEMDKLSREILLYVSHDLGYGMGWAIILVSLGIRFAFIPLIGKTQLNAIKMKLLDPEMKNFQNTMQKYQKMGDFKGVKEARKSFAQLRERYGLSTILPVISLIQVPFMITWFVSLRYVANTPDKFPSIRTDGFLWFQDLSHYDPYFILPVISAVISYYNIQLSTMNATSAVGSPLARYSRYMKFVPFLAMPFAGFFPAALNLYWIASALVQLLISVTVKAPAFRKMMGIPEYLPGSILEKLNSAKKPDIIKSMFVANEKPVYTIPKEAINTAADTTQAKAEPSAQAKPTQAAPTGAQKTVEVFANKPKKGKK